MPKKRRIDPEWWARMEAQRRELEELFERRLQRLAEADAREAARQARLRRLTLGLLGRHNPAQS